MIKVLVSAGLLTAFLCGTGLAAPISYTESTTASGSLNGVSFTNQTLSLIGTADTSTVRDFEQATYSNVLTNLGLTIRGVVSVSVAGQFYVFTTGVGFGFGAVGNGDIMDGSSAAINYSNYNLTTAVGPATGGAYFARGTLSTSAGPLTYSSTDTVTFTASVPEPGSFPDLTILLVGSLAFVSHRRATSALMNEHQR